MKNLMFVERLRKCIEKSTHEIFASCLLQLYRIVAQKKFEDILWKAPVAEFLFSQPSKFSKNFLIITFFQRQAPRGVLKFSCSKRFCKKPWKIYVAKSHFWYICWLQFH